MMNRGKTSHRQTFASQLLAGQHQVLIHGVMVCAVQSAPRNQGLIQGNLPVLNGVGEIAKIGELLFNDTAQSAECLLIQRPAVRELRHAARSASDFLFALDHPFRVIDLAVYVLLSNRPHSLLGVLRSLTHPIIERVLGDGATVSVDILPALC